MKNGHYRTLTQIATLIASLSGRQKTTRSFEMISTNSESARQMPLMSEWRGERSGDGFVARRVGELSDYQMSNGCLGEVQAQNEGELWLLCDAQTRLYERIALAESMRRPS